MCGRVVAKGNEFIEKMRACNDAIPGEEISAKIFRMETLTRRIFARVEDEPDTVADIRRPDGVLPADSGETAGGL